MQHCLPCSGQKAVKKGRHLIKKSPQQTQVENLQLENHGLVKPVSENALFIDNIIPYSCLNILYVVDLDENFYNIMKKVDLAFLTMCFPPLSPETNIRLEEHL